MLSDLVPPEWLDFLDAWDEWFEAHDRIPVGTPEWHASAQRRPRSPLECQPSDTELDSPDNDR